MNIEIAERRYLQQRAQARMRKISFTLTLTDWINIWSDSGKWEQRGIAKGQYCMSRVGDKGGYEIGNVFIQLSAQNVVDANLGKTYSTERCLAISVGLIGHTMSNETKNKISKARRGQINNPKGIKNKLTQGIN